MENDYSKALREHTFTDEPIRVSVAMIAYNLEKYLAEAIESVLDQVTNFRVELVIGEDCSTDRTREIALEYQQQYPSIIRVLLPEKNQGLTPNSAATQHACKGEYIALLDGDDYWLDATKLQWQVDLLDKHPEYSGSSHQAQIVFDDIEGKDELFGGTTTTEFDIEDTITHRKFHTSSLTYRREYWTKTGGIPTTILSNERALYPMLTIFGKIHYSPSTWCIYRRSSIGISARITSEELTKDLTMIPWLKGIDSRFPYRKFKSFLHLCIYTYPAKVKFGVKLKHFLSFAMLSFSYFPKNLGDIKYGLGKLFSGPRI